MMDENELIVLVQEALSQDIDDKELEMVVTIDTKMGDGNWDSLGHLNILTTLDARLDGKLASVSEIASANSIRSIIEILKDNDLM